MWSESVSGDTEHSAFTFALVEICLQQDYCLREVTHLIKKSIITMLTFGRRHGTLLVVAPQKPTRPAAPAKNEQGEYASFARALKKVLSVPSSSYLRKG
jgi:hypothetical protein